MHKLFKFEVRISKSETNPNVRIFQYLKQLFWLFEHCFEFRALKFGFILCILCIFTAGCGQPLRTLIGVGNEQKAQRQMVQRQDELFEKMLNDIQNDKIKQGQKLTSVVDSYGDPILTTYDGNAKTLLYRSPVQFFSATKVYLKFDENNCIEKIDIERENE